MWDHIHLCSESFHLCFLEVKDIFIQHKSIGHQGTREPQWVLEGSQPSKDSSRSKVHADES